MQREREELASLNPRNNQPGQDYRHLAAAAVQSEIPPARFPTISVAAAENSSMYI